jgi:glucose/arabinose dehydrogenase
LTDYEAKAMSKSGSRIPLLAIFFAASGISTAGHNPQALHDPIPGNIPTGPFTLKLADVIAPVNFAIDPEMPADDSGRIFVTLREGKVLIVDGGVVLGTPFLDISATTTTDAGSAMSAIAFHPDFANEGAPGEGLFYTVSQEATGTGAAHFSGTATTAAHQSVIYEWRVDDGDANLADVTSRREILRIDEDVVVHNINDMTFGPDGYLYIARGDDDMPDTEILDGTTIFGSILRLNIDDTSGNGRYSIPPDNPFVGNTEGILEEIYAYGFRNNWRLSFDRETGELYVADIGEDQIEEINIVQPGGYYGWIQKEGSFVFLGFPNPSDVSDDLSLLPPDFDGIDPDAQYDHTEGDQSITGGFVYRGSRIPSLVGHYVFGDWVSGRLFNLDPNTLEIQEISIDPTGAPGGTYIGFGETPEGELLAVTADFAASPPSRLIEVVSGLAPGLDSDGDGVDDDFDNCKFVPNGPLIPDPQGGADQQDSNGDGVGDACDLLVSTTSLPSARAGKQYSQTLAAVRGQPPYTWTLLDGSLPVGLTLINDVISGNVQSTFLTFFTVQVIDATGDTATQALSISVTLPRCYSCHAAAIH